jgi:hypothetical protein
MRRMKTSEATRRAGGRNALARLLGITGAAISQWGEDMPPLRRYQLKEAKPGWFRKQPSKSIGRRA